MRLSHIKLAGFKSFVDPTEIPLPGDLVGVVGPNGCGKSNVIDAVRWVLGESRASALRGESMQDVIFNGSANRKPVGRASVELMFDNNLGKAAGQWSSYAEICIKRILRRDGESTYHINNIHVRRRDVADIFLGTGIGGRGYAIIEQGMISRIIEAKPEELRVFLEEAAGISRYRERRRETESRLADTRENLLRVNDICQELEKQLIRLERQADIASRFRDMEDQRLRTQSLLFCARKQEAATQRALAEKELQSLQTALDAEIANLRRAVCRQCVLANVICFQRRAAGDGEPRWRVPELRHGIANWFKRGRFTPVLARSCLGRLFAPSPQAAARSLSPHAFRNADRRQFAKAAWRRSSTNEKGLPQAGEGPDHSTAVDQMMKSPESSVMLPSAAK